MSKNIVKRGYAFPPSLIEEWVKFHKPNRSDYSPSAAAAFLLYMTIDANTRESLRKLAYQKDIKDAIAKAKILLCEAIENEGLLR